MQILVRHHVHLWDFCLRPYQCNAPYIYIVAMPICDAATTHEFEVWRFWSDATGNDNNKKSFLPLWFSVLNSTFLEFDPGNHCTSDAWRWTINTSHFSENTSILTLTTLSNYSILFYQCRRLECFSFTLNFAQTIFLHFLSEIWSLYLSFERIHSEVEIASRTKTFWVKKDCKVNKECFPLSIPFLWSAHFTAGGVSFFTWPNHENFLENSNTWEKPQTMLGTWASYSKYFIFC